ncbi:MAG: hypothetical protein AAFN27_13435 [Pseudomonadota bacterium]
MFQPDRAQRRVSPNSLNTGDRAMTNSYPVDLAAPGSAARGEITIQAMMQEAGLPCDFSLEQLFDRIEHREDAR